MKIRFVNFATTAWEFFKRRKRLAIATVVFGTFSIVPLMLLAGNQAVEAVDSTLFCTQTCHTAHEAEAATVLQSAHQNVTCAQCHVGEGSLNLVKSKIQGLSEIVPTITGDYPRPIPALLENRKESHDTCQVCHSPGRYYGDVPVIKTTFATDTDNTRETNTLVLKVNGDPDGGSMGIHWHSSSDVWYMAVDGQRDAIAWVGVEGADGQTTHYVNPDLIGGVTTGQIQSEKRRMDCVDCHNRVGHPVRSAEELVDQALASGSIDQTLPYIKMVAMNALNTHEETIGAVDGKLDQIGGFYQANYPDVFQSRRQSIDSATAKLKDIAATWAVASEKTHETYQDDNLHNKTADDGAVDFAALSRQGEMQGCFRCHGTLVKTGTDAPTNGPGNISQVSNTFGETDGTSQAPDTVSGDCNLCHYTPKSLSSSGGGNGLPLAADVPHPVEALDNCLVCHNPEGPEPFKNTHNWATNGACIACHELSPDPKPLPLEAPPESPETPHSIENLDNCLLCHGPGGSEEFEPDHAWVTNETCVVCHTVSADPKPLPADSPPESPETPHSIENLENCLVCHGPTGPEPFESDHAWVTNETCSTCHTLSATPKPLPDVAPPESPETPHSIENLENCLVCHSPGGPEAVEEDHAWVTNETCSACHAVSTDPKPIVVVTPENVPQTPHVTAGLEECLACHGPMRPRQFAPDHPWVTDDVCSACHQQSPTPETTPPAPYPQAVNISHPTSGLGTCSSCHYNGGPGPFAPDHVGRPDSFCQICHQPGAGSPARSALPPSPGIPHPIGGLDSCSMCHVPGGPAPFPGSHAGRPDSLCLICHEPGSVPGPAPVGSPPPGSSPSVDGAALYSSYCTSCHGSRTSLSSLSSSALAGAINSGPGSMPAYSSTLTASEVDALVQYIRDTSSSPVPAPEPTLDGAALYSSYCTSCHGGRSSLSDGSSSGITDAIIRGPDEMPSYSSTLSTAQIDALVRYIRGP